MSRNILAKLKFFFSAVSLHCRSKVVAHGCNLASTSVKRSQLLQLDNNTQLSSFGLAAHLRTKTVDSTCQRTGCRSLQYRHDVKYILYTLCTYDLLYIMSSYGKFFVNVCFD